METDCVAETSSQIILLKSRVDVAIQPNFGHADHSRLGCGVGHTQLGAGCAANLSPSPAERHASSDTPAVRNERPAVTFLWSSAACTAANISVKASEPAMSAPLTRLMKAPNVITDLLSGADSGQTCVDLNGHKDHRAQEALGAKKSQWVIPTKAG
jgi:hypothetical protein